VYFVQSKHPTHFLTLGCRSTSVAIHLRDNIYFVVKGWADADGFLFPGKDGSLIPTPGRRVQYFAQILSRTASANVSTIVPQYFSIIAGKVDPSSGYSGEWTVAVSTNLNNDYLY
jgi:hypothetical protein